MGVARWWEQRRFGVLVHADLSTVPAWAPIGEYADWYRAHMGATAPDVLLHSAPLVETLAHHRDRWGHIEDYDDFLPFLTFDEHDPDDWTELARDAGAGFAVLVAKHHDGLCWWDAPNTNRTVLHGGPNRNVLGGFAAACERSSIVFGTSYSLLDWGDQRYPSRDYVDEILHPHVLDLVERYGTSMLWGSGHWGHGESHWRSNELIAAARKIDPEIVVNDHWWADDADVRTLEQMLPSDIQPDHWAHQRGLGPSLGHNRNERSEHQLTAEQIVALLTEVVAKNGHLLLAVGPDATGRIPSHQADPLRAAGQWIRAHRSLIDLASPWHSWGDDHVRYLEMDGVVHAVDLGGKGSFESLGRAAGRVIGARSADGAAVQFEQGDEGLTITRLDRTPVDIAAVYQVDLEPLPDAPIELFPAPPNPTIELAPLVANARPGEIVQLGDGIHIGPARVPDGVTVRGLGPDRTIIDGLESCAVSVGAGARVSHCTIRGGGQRIVWLPVTTVQLVGAEASLLGCRIFGHVKISAPGARVISCRAIGVVSKGVDSATIARSTFRGMNWDCAIELTGGAGHVIEGCSFERVLEAIRLIDVVGANVRGNHITARWSAIHLIDTDGVEVSGNAIEHTMRAIDVDGGTLAEVTGNAVSDGDSGCVIQRGASGLMVVGNRWERCRVGMLAWDAGTVRHYDNDSVDLHEPDATYVVGP